MQTGLSEKEVITLVLQGDQKAYESLVNRYRGFVFTIAFRYTGNREDAEDLAQQAFIKAYRCLNAYRGNSKFSTWLYTIVSSLCLTFLRKKKLPVKSIYLTEEKELANISDPVLQPNQAEEKSVIKLVNDAIALLNPEDAKVLILFYRAEQTLEEIGTIMGIETNNAKIKLHRARMRLKDKLQLHFAAALKESIHF